MTNAADQSIVEEVKSPEQLLNELLGILETEGIGIPIEFKNKVDEKLQGAPTYEDVVRCCSNKLLQVLAGSQFDKGVRTIRLQAQRAGNMIN